MVPNAYGPQTFGPPQLVPKNLVIMDKWSPTNLVLLDKCSLEYSICPGGQAVGIHKYEDQIGWGPFVQGDQLFGNHFSTVTEFDGDCLSGDQMGLGPNALQPPGVV